MPVPHPGAAARLAGRLARRLDAGLAVAARRNAEHSLNQARSKDLDDARSLREMRATLPAASEVQVTSNAAEPTATTVTSVSPDASGVAPQSPLTAPERSTTVPAAWS